MKFALVFSLLAALASFPNTYAAHQVLGVHGSGTTNPSKCFWNVMDMFEEQTKLPTRMTYRAVGSSTGIIEFIGNTFVPDNDFGSGDIPISTTAFTALQDAGVEMLHLPILFGAISFFHSVQTGGKKLNLDACVLAKIFKRDITDWTDQEIKDQNPGLDLQGPYPIRVARRVEGSSSTASITQFLRTACAADVDCDVEWDADMVGAKIIWPDDTLACEGSSGMNDCISEEEGTIGYNDSGHGHSEGLTEINLKNADGVYLNSKEAASLGGILSAAIGAGIPDSLGSNFGDVDLLYRDGANTWPIVALTYIYVRKDLKHIADPQEQTFLKAFLKALYKDDYVADCEESFGFVRVSGDLKDRAIAAIDTLQVTEGAEDWYFEETAKATRGSLDYVISLKRESYSELEQDQVVGLVASLQSQIDVLMTQNSQLVAAVDYLLEGSVASIQAIKNAADAPPMSFQDDAVFGEGSFGGESFEDDEETALKVSLALSIISFTLWMLALLVLIAGKFVFYCF